MCWRINIIIWLSLTAATGIVGCSSERECIDYQTYSFSQKGPVLLVESEDSGCIYNIQYDCFIDGKPISSKGKMYFDGNAFFVRLHDPKSNFFKLFDITYSEEDVYNIEIPFETGKGQLQIQLEKIVDNIKDRIYIFRAIDNFNYDDHLLDVVYFVSKQRGIIGSYFSDDYEGVKQIYEIRGDILQEKLDYSNAEFRKLN